MFLPPLDVFCWECSWKRVDKKTFTTENLSFSARSYFIASWDEGLKLEMFGYLIQSFYYTF